MKIEDQDAIVKSTCECDGTESMGVLENPENHGVFGAVLAAVAASKK